MEDKGLTTRHGFKAAPVQLASGKSVTSITRVFILWRFDNEREHTAHWLDCLVLPKCAHDLILGDAFLRATETLTKFKHRISTTLRSLGTKLLRRLNYMGTNADEGRRQLWGYLDGELVAALPDSGSDIMAVSAEYARRRGFWVDRGRDRQVMVQFADGSTAWTDGVVAGLEWEFGLGGAKPVRDDFYVLEDLPVDVVFSGDFVFDRDVFGEHDGSLQLYGTVLDALQLCNIRLIGRYGKDLERLEEEGLVDVTSPDAFSPLMVQRELARRDAIRDAILGLPVADQPSAQQAEAERQRQWERWRTEHAQRWAGIGTPSSEESTASQVSEDTTPIGTRRFMRAGRWARRNLKVVSTPLVPLRRRLSGSAEVQP
ncbi:hypothetical protein C8A01DRAFT_20385 [Parachaetomium inaequale]|uniref:Uncharacterized protein n=1 Tax=Parachaetomium inaequale TaxID=2588326 RepID=A0AAN6P833_9PEZI|nr:hypothetical protein C8A01DRAFT_20385 [Parachaetomium inaequale]